MEPPPEEESVMDLKAALVRAKIELDEAEAQFRAAQERVGKLESIRDGLELAVDLYGDAEAEDHDHGPSAGPQEPVSTAEDAGNASLRRLPGIPDPPAQDGKPSQVDLASAAVDETKQPIATTEVRVRLAAAGYDLKYDQVRGALSWLEKQGRVKRVAPGVWAPPGAATSGLNGAVRRP